MKTKASRALAILMIAAMMLSMFAFTASASGNKIKYIKTTAKCNVRIAPNKNSDKIGTAKKGEVYGYDRTKKDKRGVTWYGVIYGSYGTGWISEKNAIKTDKNGKPKHTQTPKPTAKPTPKPIDYSKFEAVDGQYMVIGESVYMRFEPSTDSSVIASYKLGSVLRAIRTNGSWMQLVDEETGRSGYMSCKYLQEYVPVEVEDAEDAEDAEEDVHDGVVSNIEELKAAVPNVELIDAPEGSTDVVYSWIDVEDMHAPIAQIAFSYKGAEFVLRAAACDTDEAAEAIDGVTLADDDHDEGVETGMHIEISEDGDYAVAHFFNADKLTQYSLTGPAIADGAAVKELAEKIFVK